MQHPDPTAVTDSHHTAARTGRLQLARLHRQHQPLQVVDFYVEDVHADNIKDRISPGTPARTRAAHRVRHRRVLRNSVAWSLLILKDPASSLLDQHADRRSPINPCSDPKSRITAQGNVGIGTPAPAPQFRLDVAGQAHASSFPTSSDAKLKTNVKQLKNVLEKVDKIRAVSFEWNEEYESLGRSTGRTEIGVIGQEVEAVFPELVTEWGDEKYKAVDYGRLTGVLIEAVKELKAQVKELKAQNEASQSRL